MSSRQIGQAVEYFNEFKIHCLQYECLHFVIA